MIRRMRVRSTFSENNPAFSSPDQAVEYSERMDRQSELSLPGDCVLELRDVEFTQQTLCFIFENDTALRFAIHGDDVRASYEALGGEYCPLEQTSEEDRFDLQFPGSDASFEWRPLAVLKSVLKQELLDLYQLRNQYYLYFESECIYVRTLMSVDEGERFLFWTTSK
jgi:hypothetical protein